MHKAFISYHHKNDQRYKNDLVAINDEHRVFVDRSVDTGDVSDDLSDEVIREKVRDEYLRDSTVTIVLVGQETKGRKHVDWEIHSSMIDGRINKKSGILVVNLPSTDCTCYTAPHGKNEQDTVYPENKEWVTIDSRTEYERRYPYMPDRIVDNLLKAEAKVSVTCWSKILDPAILRFLVDTTFQDRHSCKYDLSRPMRRANS